MSFITTAACSNDSGAVLIIQWVVICIISRCCCWSKRVFGSVIGSQNSPLNYKKTGKQKPRIKSNAAVLFFPLQFFLLRKLSQAALACRKTWSARRLAPCTASMPNFIARKFWWFNHQTSNDRLFFFMVHGQVDLPAYPSGKSELLQDVAHWLTPTYTHTRSTPEVPVDQSIRIKQAWTLPSRNSNTPKTKNFKIVGAVSNRSLLQQQHRSMMAVNEESL